MLFAAVKLHSWAIKSVGSKAHAPRKVRMFINRPSLGFSEASEFPAVQEFELSNSDLEGKPLPLKCASLPFDSNYTTLKHHLLLPLKFS